MPYRKVKRCAYNVLFSKSAWFKNRVQLYWYNRRKYEKNWQILPYFRDTDSKCRNDQNVQFKPLFYSYKGMKKFTMEKSLQTQNKMLCSHGMVILEAHIWSIFNKKQKVQNYWTVDRFLKNVDIGLEFTQVRWRDWLNIYKVRKLNLLNSRGEPFFGASHFDRVMDRNVDFWDRR